MKATLKILVLGSLATASTAAFAGETAEPPAERAKPTLNAFAPAAPSGLKVPAIATRGAGPVRIGPSRILAPDRPTRKAVREGRKPPPR